MKRMLLGAAVLASTVSTFSFAEEGPVFSTLSTRRAQITLPAYTPEEKQLVAEQAKLVLSDLYVNRERKIQFYGLANDPVPAASQVALEARGLADEDLHARLETIFQSQHDHHLSYRFPEPYACYRSAMPFSLAQAYAPDGQLVVAVSSLTAEPKILAVDAQFAKIAVGDVLLSYDGLPAFEAAKALENLGGGSNDAGRVRSAIQLMTYRSQRQHKLPGRDLLRLSFKNRLGEVYDLEVPWVTWGVPTCLNPQTGGGLGRLAKQDGSDEYQVEFEKLYKPHKRSSESEAVTDTEEPTLHWDVINNEYGRFAYLRLDSFVPETLQVPQVVMLVKKLLQNELAGTDGLIFDLRDNGGGMITYGESLVQLFTPKNIAPLGFRLLNSQANRDIFRLNPVWGDDFGRALDVAQTIGARYTVAIPFATASQLNDVAQAYFKPVAVLTNSSCYSTCDMTTASMQDHGVATIWGEDGATGGGGANNMQLADFVAAFPTDQQAPLKALPGKQGIGVAWRQTVRVGAHAGQLLEETGAVADKLATPTLADFFTASAQQFRRISADLNQMSRLQKSWFKTDLKGRVDLTAGQPIEFAMKASATEAVELRAKGETLGYQVLHAPASAGGTPVQVKVPGTPDVGTLGAAEIIGYLQGERVWRAVQTYRIIPTSTAVADGTRIAMDFSTPEVAPLTIFTSGDDQAKGWTVVDGKLRTGTGATYVDNVTTEASLFLDLTARTAPATLSFDVSGKTEEGYDFFAVSAIVAGELTNLLAPVSGDISPERKSFDLTPYLGKVVELRIGFASDAGVVDQGISLSNLVVE